MIAYMSIDSKLQRLKEYVGYLKGYQKYPLEELLADHTLQGAVFHYLQLSIESMLDIGELIISEQGFSKPEESRAVFKILAQHRVIPKKFAEKIAPIAGLRNILVHEYSDVDIKKVYGHLKNDLKDFDSYAKHIAKFIRKRK